MAFKLFSNFFDYNTKEIKNLRSQVDAINLLEDKARVLKDEDFKKETEKFKKQLKKQEKTLDEIMPWAFALVREASRRVLGLRHFHDEEQSQP